MTEKEFSKLLAELGENAAALNAASDRLTELVKAASRQLQQYNVGLESHWFPIDERPHQRESAGGAFEDCKLNTEVAFAKDNTGTWGLCVREAVYREELAPNGGQYGVLLEVTRLWPLSEASRDIRIQGLRHIPSIVKNLNEKAKQALDVIHAAEKFVTK